MFTSASWQCPVCDRPGDLHDERCLVLEIAQIARRRKDGNRRLVQTNGRLRERVEQDREWRREFLERAEAAEAEAERLREERDALGLLAAQRRDEVRGAEYARERMAYERNEARDTANFHAEKRQAAEAEVARLTNKLNEDSQNFEIECLKAERDRLEYRAESAEAEVQRLTEGLREIESLPFQSEDWHENDVAVRIARDTLAASPSGGGGA